MSTLNIYSIMLGLNTETSTINTDSYINCSHKINKKEYDKHIIPKKVNRRYEKRIMFIKQPRPGF
jgi:hypothetical protein